MPEIAAPSEMIATTPSVDEPGPPLAAPPEQASRMGWFVLIMLMCVYSFSWMDRFLLVILIDPISKDLHVSNTQIGLFTGFGASLLYSLAGFPIARLADRASRTRIVSGVLGAWSGLTVATAAVGSFFTLLLTRFGIAIASAGCSPAAYSLISDYFPARSRGTAIAIYSLGIPGVLFAIVLAFVLKEPRRGRFDTGGEEVHRHFTAREASGFFLKNRGFMAIAFGFGLIACATSAFENWIPTYLIRADGLSATEVGAISGLFQGLTGIVGALGFGILADVFARRDER
ncbi:MFS transporter [Novosphingobium sp. MBES04]|uniref:MFS transporter n=1 Tax=Novosphingobium sp. MBES04 TaxID=1206458 RepID=UPI00057E056E|nr:MFS transporter [Novosphingobium sp. MBES04]